MSKKEQVEVPIVQESVGVDSVPSADEKITELETVILGKDADIDTANKKIIALENELEAVKKEIISNEKSQGELGEFCEIEEVEARTVDGNPIEYLIKGTDVGATVIGIIPAGQNAQFNETAVRVKIDGVDLTLTESLVKKVFVKKVEVGEK